MNKIMKMLGVKGKKPYHNDETIDFDEIFSQEPFEDDDDYPDEEFDEVYGGDSKSSDKKMDNRDRKAAENSGNSRDKRSIRDEYDREQSASKSDYEQELRPAREPEYEKDIRPAREPEYEKDIRPAREPEYEKELRPAREPEYEKDIRPALEPEYEQDIRPDFRNEFDYNQDTRPMSGDGYNYDQNARPVSDDGYNYDQEHRTARDYDTEYDREPVREPAEADRFDRDPGREPVQARRSEYEPVKEQVHVQISDRENVQLKRTESEPVRESEQARKYDREPGEESSKVQKESRKSLFGFGKSSKTGKKDSQEEYRNSKESRQTRDSKEAKNSRKLRDARDDRDSREARDTRDSRDARDAKQSRDAKRAQDSKKARDNRDVRDTRDSRDARDAKQSRDAKHAQDSRKVRDSRDARDAKDSRGSRDSRDVIDVRGSRDARDSRDSRQPRDVKNAQDSRKMRDSIDLFDSKDIWDSPNSRNMRDDRSSRDNRDSRDFRDNRDRRDSRDIRDRRDSRDLRDRRESRDFIDDYDDRDYYDSRDARDSRDYEYSRDSRDSRNSNKSRKASSIRKNKKNRNADRYKEPALSKVIDFVERTSFAERAAVIGALIILVGVVVMINFYSGALGRVNKIKSFDEVGADFKAEVAVGLAGINAIRDAEKAKLVAENPEEESEEELAEEAKNINIVMTLTSIKSDMKIKFIDSSTNKLVSNVPFAVSVENPDGTKVTYDDHDQDGIIYKNNLTSGVYQITPVALADNSDKYNIPIATQSLTIKDKVEMKAVDVSNEIKKESEVNVAAEDTAVQETVESELKDTVDYIESTQTSEQENAGGNESQEFETIDRSLIVDPTTTSKLEKLPSSRVTTYGLPVRTASSGLSTYKATTCELPVGNTAYGQTTSTTSQRPAYSVMKLAATNADSEVIIIEGDTNTSTQSTTTQPSNDETEVIIIEQPDTPEEKKPETSVSENGSSQGSSNTNNNANSQGTANTGNSTESQEPTITESGTTTGNNNTSQGTTTTETTAPSNAATQNASTSDEPVIIEVNPDASSTASTTTTTTTPSQSTTGSTESEGIVIIEQAPTTEASTTGKTTTSDDTVIIQEGTTTTAGVEFSTKNLEPTITEETEKEKENKKLEFLSYKVTVAVGKEFTIEPVDDSLKVTYSSADKKIATISKNGTIKGVAAGETTIKAKCDGYETAEITVTVEKDTTPLKDKDGNIIYVKENGKYREATAEDLKKEGVVFYVDKAKNYKYTGWQTIDGKTYYYDKNGNYVTGEQVIQGAKYVFDDKGVLTKSSGTLGIDVSKWNGNIDWNKVKKSNVSYAIIRCGYRGSSQGALIEDPQFRTNIQGALDAGLKVGVYFFTQALNEVEAVEEASMVIDLIKGYNVTLPVYLDVEASNGRGDEISASQRTANIKAFCGTLQSAGYRPGIYSNKTWYTTKMNVSSLTNYHIWLAQYAASVTYTTSRYDMWQYTSKGKVSGISGNVDLDLLYNN